MNDCNGPKLCWWQEKCWKMNSHLKAPFQQRTVGLLLLRNPSPSSSSSSFKGEKDDDDDDVPFFYSTHSWI